MINAAEAMESGNWHSEVVLAYQSQLAPADNTRLLLSGHLRWFPPVPGQTQHHQYTVGSPGLSVVVEKKR